MVKESRHSFLGNVLAVAYKEAGVVRHDRALLAAVFVQPVMMLVLSGLVLSNKPANVPWAVIDRSQSHRLGRVGDVERPANPVERGDQPRSSGRPANPLTGKAIDLGEGAADLGAVGLLERAELVLGGRMLPGEAHDGAAGEPRDAQPRHGVREAAARRDGDVRPQQRLDDVLGRLAFPGNASRGRRRFDRAWSRRCDAVGYDGSRFGHGPRGQGS